MKLLSVAIPCYNSQEYMRKCIESLLKGGEDVEMDLKAAQSSSFRTGCPGGGDPTVAVFLPFRAVLDVDTIVFVDGNAVAFGDEADDVVPG